MNPPVVLLTGGGSGIGRSVALLCASRGQQIAVLDIAGDRARQTVTEAHTRGAATAIAVECDVSNEKQVDHAFTDVEQRLGVATCICANAGIDRGGALHDLPPERWRTVLDVNLTGIFLKVRRALRAMLAAKSGGSIVDYARYGIRVNAIVPGATETPLMWENVPAVDVAEMRALISSEIPLGRLADPDEPARAAVWLLSDEASDVTGSHLVCDGGILAKASISF